MAGWDSHVEKSAVYAYTLPCSANPKALETVAPGTMLVGGRWGWGVVKARSQPTAWKP